MALPYVLQNLPKALLLALLVGAPAAGQDIVVETDIGEKYIIKMSAVTIKAKITRASLITKQYQGRLQVLSDGIERINKNMLRMRSQYLECLESKAFSKDFCDYRQSDDFLKAEEERLQYVTKNKESVKNEMVAEIGLKPDLVAAFMLRYRPIFIDLNNQKKGLNYVNIICPRPSLSANAINEIKSIYPDYTVASPSDIAIKSAENMLCKRIASF